MQGFQLRGFLLPTFSNLFIKKHHARYPNCFAGDMDLMAGTEKEQQYSKTENGRAMHGSDDGVIARSLWGAANFKMSNKANVLTNVNN